MTTIDYAKYTNMSTKQLVHSLENAKKQRRKFQAQVKNADNLIAFLSDKIHTQKYDFVAYEKSGLPELTKKVKKQFTPQELAQLRQELDDEINRDYGDEL